MKEVVSYILSLLGCFVNVKEVEVGKVCFVVCFVCYGIDGKGNLVFGVLNLMDNDWLFGDLCVEVIEMVMNGCLGVMFVWINILGEEKI